MSGLNASFAGLRNRFYKDVMGGHTTLNLAITSTGTGLGSANYKLGMCVLDSSSSKWFLCTATTGSGTWVQVQA